MDLVRNQGLWFWQETKACGLYRGPRLVGVVRNQGLWAWYEPKACERGKWPKGHISTEHFFTTIIPFYLHYIPQNDMDPKKEAASAYISYAWWTQKNLNFLVYFNWVAILFVYPVLKRWEMDHLCFRPGRRSCLEEELSLFPSSWPVLCLGRPMAERL